MPAQWNLWYEDVALPPCSDPGKPYSLELSWQNRHSNKRICRSSDHRREPPQTAAAEIVTPSGSFEVQCLAHSGLRFLIMECGRNTTPTCSKGCARPGGRNEEDSSTTRYLAACSEAACSENDSEPRVHRSHHRRNGHSFPMLTDKSADFSESSSGQRTASTGFGQQHSRW